MHNKNWTPQQLNACSEGCYKHLDKASGKWVCCKCNT
jgi:hypothetical protein